MCMLRSTDRGHQDVGQWRFGRVGQPAYSAVGPTLFPNLSRALLAPTTAKRDAPRNAWILDEADIVGVVALRRR